MSVLSVCECLRLHVHVHVHVHVYVYVYACVCFVFCVRSHSIEAKNLANLMSAGPRVTTYIAGKRKKTSGNTSFTPIFAARSSAFWRRLVRLTSACVRSACATLVPKRSVCMSIDTS